MSKVVNLRSGARYDVRIDRATRWGNPFTHRADVARKRKDVTLVSGGPKEAIEAYRNYLWNEIKAGRVTLDDLADLHGKKLACWCAPGPCHGDVLVRAAAWAYGELAAKDAADAEHNL